MLGKLLKYDLKWINKVMIIYYAIIAIITIAVKIIETFEQTLLMIIIDKILTGMFISCIISIIITCIMRVWARFIQNIYKDESYLTHTLPVTKSEIFNSKILASIISLIITIIIILICASFIYLNSSTIETIKVMFESLVSIYNKSFAILFIVGLILLILLEVIYFMLTGIFGIIIGYRFNNHKTLKSIIIGIISYMSLTIIAITIINIMSKLADFKIVVEGFPSINTIKIMGLTAISIYLIFDCLYFFTTKNLLKKGINVD